jgi:hypothetical protein
MFTIIPNGQTTILKQFGEMSAEATALLSSVVPDSQLPPSADRPSIQLAHSEITDDEVERALGYAGITKANGPVGVPVPTAPSPVGRDFLIFSLQELEMHLRQTARDTVADYERVGGMSAFVESREITAFEYLVAGLIECIRWCIAHRAALSIRW